MHRDIPGALLLVFVCACAAPPAASRLERQASERASRSAWLAHEAVPMRSIDPSIRGDDFADLEPLCAMIGDARVVVLGEQSHGDGATFLAKGRLLEFLHQRMGFDVLAWEAGLFNVHDMDAMVRDPGTPIDMAMGRGLFPIWATSAQVRPVFEYARSTLGTNRPLEMIGFDHQFSGAGGATRWCHAIIAFLDKADPGLLPAALRTSLQNGLRGVFRPDTTAADIRSLAETWKVLPGLLDSARSSLDAAHSAPEVALMRRSVDAALVSLEGLARMREAGGTFRAADSNLRDRWMGETLTWLVNERYKGRRIVVWAASFHTLHEPSAILPEPGSDFSYRDVVTMGQVVHEALGDAVYTIGFTAAEGSAARASGGEPLQLSPPLPGSFEDLCANVGRPFLFVNLRGVPADHWLRQPLNARPLAHSEIETDWTRQLDALVFTRTMFPSTQGPMVPEGAVLTESPVK